VAVKRRIRGKTICKLQGVLFLILAIAGLVSQRFLGMHLTLLHTVVHFLTAGIALYLGFAGTPEAARTFCVIGGAVYVLLVLLGFLAPNILATVIGHATPVTARELMPDNIVHIILGIIFFLGTSRSASVRPAR